jgi:hypothetical protein
MKETGKTPLILHALLDKPAVSRKIQSTVKVNDVEGVKSMFFDYFSNATPVEIVSNCKKHSFNRPRIPIRRILDTHFVWGSAAHAQ